MLYKLLPFILIFYSSSAFGNYQVCSITINSSDEIETFKQFLPSNDFQFVELLPPTKSPGEEQSSHWFEEACVKRLQM